MDEMNFYSILSRAWKSTTCRVLVLDMADLCSISRSLSGVILEHRARWGPQTKLIIYFHWVYKPVTIALEIFYSSPYHTEILTRKGLLSSPATTPTNICLSRHHAVFPHRYALALLSSIMQAVLLLIHPKQMINFFQPHFDYTKFNSWYTYWQYNSSFILFSKVIAEK